MNIDDSNEPDEDNCDSLLGNSQGEGYQILARMIARRITGDNITDHNSKDKAARCNEDAEDHGH
ncbi:hypothetical protein ACFLVK_01985 [Chloroflexota bacterium]